MNIDQFFSGLSKSSGCNEALQFLYDINVNCMPELAEKLKVIASDPEAIENTNAFASLLVKLSREEFVSPLVEGILKGRPGESSYLSDYLYALNGIIETWDEWMIAEDDFVHLLGNWLLSTGGGEISWKSGLILSQLENPSTRKYCLKGALNSSLFHLARIACLRCIVNHYREDASKLIANLVDDDDAYVKAAALDAQEFLEQKSE